MEPAKGSSLSNTAHVSQTFLYCRGHSPSQYLIPLKLPATTVVVIVKPELIIYCLNHKPRATSLSNIAFLIDQLTSAADTIALCARSGVGSAPLVAFLSWKNRKNNANTSCISFNFCMWSFDNIGSLSASDVKMEIPVLAQSLKSSILSSTSLQMDKTSWRVVSAAV